MATFDLLDITFTVSRSSASASNFHPAVTKLKVPESPSGMYDSREIQLPDEFPDRVNRETALTRASLCGIGGCGGGGVCGGIGGGVGGGGVGGGGNGGGGECGMYLTDAIGPMLAAIGFMLRSTKLFPSRLTSTERSTPTTATSSTKASEYVPGHSNRTPHSV